MILSDSFIIGISTLTLNVISDGFKSRGLLLTFSTTLPLFFSLNS